MSIRPEKPEPEPIELTTRSYPPLGEHKRTAFILSSAGHAFGELIAICNTSLIEEDHRDPRKKFTIRRKFPDTRFVEILPPCNREYTSYPDQLPFWFKDKNIDWVKSGYICEPPRMGDAIQAVIDLIFMEKYQNNIPFANMFIGGIGQAGTVALGVVVACGVEPIRYVGIDAKFPILNHTQSIGEIMEAWGGNTQVARLALTVKIRVKLNLTVSDPTHNDTPGTKKNGGLISLIHHERTETPEDVIHRNLALRTLASAGYKTHLGYCLTTKADVHYDHLFALLRSLVDNLEYMGEDDGTQDSRGSLPFMPRYVNLQDVHWTPVPVPTTVPRPLDLTAALEGEPDDDGSPWPKITRMQMIHLRRSVLESLRRDQEQARMDARQPTTPTPNKRPSTATTGTSAGSGKGPEGDRVKRQKEAKRQSNETSPLRHKDAKRQSNETSPPRREDIIARRREEIISRRQKYAARRDKAANGL